MKRRPLLTTGVLVFVAGGLGGWWVSREQVGRRFERTQSAQLPHPPGRTANAQHPEPDLVVTEVVDADDADAEAFPEKLREEVGRKRQARIETRVSALKARLGLSEDQVIAVRSLLEKSIPNHSQFLAKLMAGSRGDENAAKPTDFFKLLRPPGTIDPAFDLALTALLRADQQAAYATFQQQERTNQIGINANRELARLQELMTLSGDQRDRVLAALSDLAGKEIDQPFDENAFELASLGERQTQRLEALQHVLTPEQLAIYESNPYDLVEMVSPLEEAFGFIGTTDEEADGTETGTDLIKVEVKSTPSK